MRLEGVTHVAGAPSEERRTRLFGACKFQPVKGPAGDLGGRDGSTSSAPPSRRSRRGRAGGPPFPIPPDQIVHGAAVSEALIRSAASGKDPKKSCA